MSGAEAGAKRCYDNWLEAGTEAGLAGFRTLIMIALLCFLPLPWLVPIWMALIFANGLLTARIVRQALAWWDLRNRWIDQIQLEDGR